MHSGIGQSWNGQVLELPGIYTSAGVHCYFVPSKNEIRDVIENRKFIL
jgi:hypothetical protein